MRSASGMERWLIGPFGIRVNTLRNVWKGSYFDGMVDFKRPMLEIQQSSYRCIFFFSPRPGIEAYGLVQVDTG
jgi:hypothetical protein